MSSNLTDVIELTEYHLNEGVDREEFLAAYDGIRDDLNAIPGFRSGELYESDDGEWVEVVRWESREQAEQAVETAMTIESFGRFFSFIDESTIEMRHLRTVRASGNS